MTLAMGTKLGSYEVTAEIGKGGMGEVYRERDAKLGRDVALKVLPASFARDAERMARFEREAKVLASLDHPNIASIYGVEDSGATLALVMQFRQRIPVRAHNATIPYSLPGLWRSNPGANMSAGKVSIVARIPWPCPGQRFRASCPLPRDER